MTITPPPPWTRIRSLYSSVAVWPNSSVAANLILTLGLGGGGRVCFLSCFLCLSLTLILVSSPAASCFVVFLILLPVATTVESLLVVRGLGRRPRRWHSSAGGADRDVVLLGDELRPLLGREAAARERARPLQPEVGI